MPHQVDLSPTDQQLIQQTLKGNQEAFGELVQRYRAPLLAAMLKISGHHTDAEDIVQDALLQAFVKLAGFRGHSSFYTWLYRIAINRLITCNRQGRRTTSLDVCRETGVEPADPHGTPDGQLARSEQSGQLAKALSTLSDEHRRILKLRGIEGYDYDAIGQILHVRPGTVRSRLHRARTQLRDELQRTLYYCS